MVTISKKPIYSKVDEAKEVNFFGKSRENKVLQAKLYIFVTALLISMSLSSCEVIKEKVGLGAAKDIPLGEYTGTAKPLNSEEGAETKVVKINFLPKESGYKDAIGVLVFDNSSDRFLWRSDGNNQNIWNIMFSKDNTLYTNIKESFEFSGVIKSSDLKNTLEGKFTRIIEEEQEVYYFKASQIFQPSLETPEAPIVVKAGAEITINATKLDPEKIKILMLPLEGEGEAKQMTLTNSSFEKGTHTLTFASSKDQKKGKYKVSIERDDGEKSKSIVVEIK